MHIITLRAIYTGALFLLILAVLPAQVFAQEKTCQEILEEANTLYSRGAFDETIQLLDQCLESDELDETLRKTAYRLKGLSFIGKGLEVDARESVKRLLQLVPSYEPDPVMDPPNFIDMIVEVRQEIQTQLTPESEQAQETVDETVAVIDSQAQETADQERQSELPVARQEEPSRPPATPVASSSSSSRKKKGGKKWLIGGIGVAAAGGLAAVLLSGGGNGGGGGNGIAEPPALP